METQVLTTVDATVDEVLGRVAELEPMIRAASAQAEIERRLSTHLAEALRDAGCYRLFRPRSRGGLELDPVSAFQVIEELSHRQRGRLERRACQLHGTVRSLVFG
jgi:alkylation response protein AidB-like acyl-CoA dehydrogenase